MKKICSIILKVVFTYFVDKLLYWYDIASNLIYEG